MSGGLRFESNQYTNEVYHFLRMKCEQKYSHPPKAFEIDIGAILTS